MCTNVGVLDRTACEPLAMYWKYTQVFTCHVSFYIKWPEGVSRGGGGNCFSLSFVISSCTITSKGGQTVYEEPGGMEPPDSRGSGVNTGLPC